VNAVIAMQDLKQSPWFAHLDACLQERGAATNSAPLCLEATGPCTEHATLALVDFGWMVSVVNPDRIKGFAPSWRVTSGSTKSTTTSTASRNLNRTPT
jgi:hypothetical protein